MKSSSRGPRISPSAPDGYSSTGDNDRRRQLSFGGIGGSLAESDNERRRGEVGGGDWEAISAIHDVYRRVTANLAASAWGDEVPPPVARLGRERVEVRASGTSAFVHAYHLDKDEQIDSDDKTVKMVGMKVRRTAMFRENGTEMDNTFVSKTKQKSFGKHTYPSSSSDESFNRKIKVAKASYSDHGSHAKIKEKEGGNKESILKRILMYSLQETMKKMEQGDEEDIGDEDEAYKDKNQVVEQPTSNIDDTDQNNHKRGLGQYKQKNSSLSEYKMANPKESSSVANHRSNLHAALNLKSPPRSPLTPPSPSTHKKCLTSPSSPCSNNGLDNSEGNLIVHVNDILSIPNHHITPHSSSTAMATGHIGRHLRLDRRHNETTNFLVLELLGQGTFAQVFKCRNTATNELVAVKVVKNKPAYTRQAAVEIDVFRALMGDHNSVRGGKGNREGHSKQKGIKGNQNMVTLISYFMYHSHLCLVFELLGLNLYEVLKRRQFRGLPITTVQSLLRQAIEAIKDLSQRSVVHCDLKPENILLVGEALIKNIIDAGDLHAPSIRNNQPDTARSRSPSSTLKNRETGAEEQKIKLIDFGSACFEGQTAHTYIQSRFYRSPEVLVGLPYDSAIDMWSLGCVAAELFLGLPILPGVHEHDQLSRINEMIGVLPDWMMDQGTKAKKYFMKIPNANSASRSAEPPSSNVNIWNNTDLNSSRAKSVLSRSSHSPNTVPSATPPPPKPSWRLKTWQEYLSSLPPEEKANRNGLSKLDQQSTNRYFKRKKLAEIVMLHGQYSSNEDKKMLRLFVHFLKGVLDPDPWKRWTAHQVSTHPFITRNTPHQSNEWQNDTHRRGSDVYWVPPWDPSICRRKLLSVQKAREKQAQSRKSNATYAVSNQHITAPRDTASDGVFVSSNLSPDARVNPVSPEFSATSRMTAMTDAMSLSQPISMHPNSLPNMGIALKSTSPPLSLESTNECSRPNSRHIQTGGSVNDNPNGNCDTTSHNVSVSYHQSPDGSRYVQALTPTLHHNSSMPQQLPQGQGSNSWIEAQYSPATAFVVSPSLHNVNYPGYGDYPYHVQAPHLSPMTGPQSFSGVYYDRISTHLPVEAELAYALQRPGVVPSMGNDPNNISNIGVLQQQPNGTAFSFVHHQPQRHNGNITSTNTKLVASPNNAHENSARRWMPGTKSPRHIPLNAQSQDQSIDSNDLAFLTRKTVQSELHAKSPNTCDERTATRSLLAQQLAEHSARMTTAHHSNHSHVSTIQYQHQHQHQQSSVQQQRHVNAQLGFQHHTPPSYQPHQHQHQHQRIVYGSAGNLSSPGPINSINLHSASLSHSHHGRAYYSIPSTNAPPVMLSNTTRSNASDFRDFRVATTRCHHYVHSPNSGLGTYPMPYHVQVVQQQQPQPPSQLPSGSIGLDIHAEPSISYYSQNTQPPPPYRGMSM